MKLKKFVKKYKVGAIIAAVATILAFAGMDILSAQVILKPKLFVVVAFSLIVAIIFLLNSLIEPTNSHNDTEINNIKGWSHSILIIDNKAADLATIMDHLNGYNYDIVTLKDISDYRLVENFEIIISDIWGLGAVGKDSISVLNQIKLKYPYKIVLAMSNAPAACKGLEIDGVIISKEDKKSYPKEILKRIRDYSSRLDNCKKHWNNVKLNLKGRDIPISEQKIIKEDYYNSIKRNHRSLT